MQSKKLAKTFLGTRLKMKVSFREIYIICAGDDGCMKVAIFFYDKKFCYVQRKCLVKPTYLFVQGFYIL